MTSDSSSLARRSGDSLPAATVRRYARTALRMRPRASRSPARARARSDDQSGEGVMGRSAGGDAVVVDNGTGVRIRGGEVSVKEIGATIFVKMARGASDFGGNGD